jgi:hypothetical protein
LTDNWPISFGDFPLCREELDISWSAADEHQRAEWLRQNVVPLDFPEAVAADWPELLTIVEEKVRPTRLAQGSIVNPARWWMFARPASDLYRATRGLQRVLLCSRIGNAFAITFMPAGVVLNEKIVVFPFDGYAPFSVIQSRVHEGWARFFSSTLKDD